MRPSVLRNSGLGARDYPVLNAVLHDWRVGISAGIACLLFLWFILSLKRGAYRYRFKQVGFAVISGLFISYAVNCMTSLIHLGKVWAIFVPLIVAVNDTSAYIVGMTTGKTPLIRLSPNKTMEGFLGGGLLTLWVTFLCVDYLLSVDYLLCPTEYLTWTPFEQ